MKKLILMIIFGISAGCVSVNLPKSTGEKAKSIQLVEPTTPFNEIKNENADRAWISEKTGNTISYLSDCNNPVDPSLQQIESESLTVLTDLKIVSSKETTSNGRVALETIASGTVDGVKVQMKILTFKKNSCSFSLIYGGVEKFFNDELPTFKSFVGNFKYL